MSEQPQQSNYAIVWPWDQAPPELRALSKNGGDEDWVVELPPCFSKYYLCWLYATDTCHEPDEYPHPSKPGWIVAIGAHA